MILISGSFFHKLFHPWTFRYLTSQTFGLQRCWWRMLKTKCVGDNCEMLVTVLAIFVTKILYLPTLSSGINIQKMSPISKFCHQHQKLSPTWSRQHRLVTNIYVADICHLWLRLSAHLWISESKWIQNSWANFNREKSILVKARL